MPKSTPHTGSPGLALEGRRQWEASTGPGCQELRDSVWIKGLSVKRPALIHLVSRVSCPSGTLPGLHKQPSMGIGGTHPPSNAKSKPHPLAEAPGGVSYPVPSVPPQTVPDHHHITSLPPSLHLQIQENLREMVIFNLQTI